AGAAESRSNMAAHRQGGRSRSTFGRDPRRTQLPAQSNAHRLSPRPDRKRAGVQHGPTRVELAPLGFVLVMAAIQQPWPYTVPARQPIGAYVARPGGKQELALDHSPRARSQRAYARRTKASRSAPVGYRRRNQRISASRARTSSAVSVRSLS